jgi:hypothetical protein
MLKLQWLNCLWLLIPILAWNAIFSSKLAHPAFEFDEAAPRWVLLLENLLRFVVFVLPLFMPLRWDTAQSKLGTVVYVIGVLVYFASWIPLMIAPESGWSNSLFGFLAPAYTPLIWLIGMGLMGGWWPYLILSVVFVGVHMGHWWQVYERVVG